MGDPTAVHGGAVALLTSAKVAIGDAGVAKSRGPGRNSVASAARRLRDATGPVGHLHKPRRHIVSQAVAAAVTIHRAASCIGSSVRRVGAISSGQVARCGWENHRGRRMVDMTWRMKLGGYNVALAALNRTAQPVRGFQMPAMRTHAWQALVGLAQDVRGWSGTGGVAVASIAPGSIFSQLDDAVGVRLRQ